MFAITKRYSHALTLARQSVRLFTTFEQGDFCMLRQVKTNKKFFIGPLEVTGERGMKGGNISHDNIIGKKPRSIIRTSNGKSSKQKQKEVIF